MYLHIEACDEAGHEGDALLKVRAIEDIDRRVVKLIREAVDAWDEPVAIAVLPDHPTPCALRTHTADPVPFLIYKPGQTPDATECYDEQSVAKGRFGLLRGNQFIQSLLQV